MPKGDTESAEHEIKYIVRIAQTDLDGKKAVQYALTGLKGVGIRGADSDSTRKSRPRRHYGLFGR